jgi:hypothetical protein
MVSEILMQIGIGLGIVLISIVGISKPLNWLPFKVIKVKSSGGKKILMRERRPAGNVYYVASMSGLDAIWNDKIGFFKDDKGRITIPHKAIHTEFGGCKVVEFDEKGRLYCPNGDIISGFDPKHYQDLLDRESQKPAENSAMEKLKLFLAIFTFIGLLVIGFLVFKNSQKSDMIIESFNNLQQIMINSTVQTV